MENQLPVFSIKFSLDDCIDTQRIRAYGLKYKLDIYEALGKLKAEFLKFEYPDCQMLDGDVDLGDDVDRPAAMVKCLSPLSYFQYIRYVFKFQNFGNTCLFSIYKLYERKGKWRSEAKMTYYMTITNPAQEEYLHNLEKMIESLISFGVKLLKDADPNKIEKEEEPIME